MAMQCGNFATPYGLPTQTTRLVLAWQCDKARPADEAGSANYTIVEHGTSRSKICVPEKTLA